MAMITLNHNEHNSSDWHSGASMPNAFGYRLCVPPSADSSFIGLAFRYTFIFGSSAKVRYKVTASVNCENKSARAPLGYTAERSPLGKGKPFHVSSYQLPRLD